MAVQSAAAWRDTGARNATVAQSPRAFIEQYLSPLFVRRTEPSQGYKQMEIVSEEQFWRDGGARFFTAVRLTRFRITDWFPRAPGVYWSRNAGTARETVWLGHVEQDTELGKYYSPEGKMALIEEGGIGTVRLLPRRIDGEDCWFATALTDGECHQGIPLAIPHAVLRESNLDWGEWAQIEGTVRILRDFGLGETAAQVRDARPLIVKVEKMRGVVHEPAGPVVITPVVLFAGGETQSPDQGSGPRYTFTSCPVGVGSDLEEAVDWMAKYAKRYMGKIITNFDEQLPFLAEAPLSYQRLVAKTYDRVVINQYGGKVLADKVEKLERETTNYYGTVNMGHTISVGGSAVINIDSTLQNVNQTIGVAPGLDSMQKSQLEALVQTLKADLEKLSSSHADETSEIAAALKKAVTNASKPPGERKQSVLQLSVNGLIEAASLVKDVAPAVLSTARMIGRFISDL